MKRIKTNVYLDPAEKKLLDRLSEKTGAPITELVRRAIREYLKSRAKELK